MKSIQIIQPGEIQIIDVPRPVIQSDEVLVRVLYAGDPSYSRMRRL